MYIPAVGFLSPTLISPIHAPFTIFPMLLPQSKFLLALRFQPSHNVRYAQATVDEKFLDEVRWGALKALGRWTSSSAGCRSVGNSCGVGVFNRYVLTPFPSLILTDIERKSWHLGLFRSDHLLRKPEAGGKEASLKQVECDTTSPGMPLSSCSATLHRFIPRHRIVSYSYNFTQLSW